MSPRKAIVYDMEPNPLRMGIINNPDTFNMHCICRIWRTDWETAIKFESTRIFIEAIVEIRMKNRDLDDLKRVLRGEF